MEWNKTFGINGSDYGNDIQQTTDGGYIIAAQADLGLIKRQEFWLIKTDSKGNLQWDRMYGDTSFDTAYSVEQTIEGGYIATGSTWPHGSDNSNILLIKTNPIGYIEWNRTYGSSDHEIGYSVKQTADAGYIIVGSKKISLAPEEYSTNIWLIKIDPLGHMSWNRTFGGEKYDLGSSVQQTTDGGYIIAGSTDSFSNGSSDIWLIKTDAVGQIQWNKTFGGSGFDSAVSVVQTADNGYLIVGTTTSFGAGNYDAWILKTDSAGNLEWDLPIGGPDYDRAFSAIQASDGSYVIAGSTRSYGAGLSDAWLIKLNPIEYCYNGVDDDLDGNIDCADPDCYMKFCTINGSMICKLGSCIHQTNCEKADVNLDGAVNVLDLNKLRKNLNMICNIYNDWCNYSDYNKDGIVNALDMSRVRMQFACHD